MVKLNNKIRY